MHRTIVVVFTQKMVGDLPRQWLTALNAYGSSSVTAATPMAPDAPALPLFTDSSMPRHRQWYLMARSVHVSSPVAAAPPPPTDEYVGLRCSLRLRVQTLAHFDPACTAGYLSFGSIEKYYVSL